MRNKGFLLATAGGVAFSPAAQAADLPVKAPRPVPVAVVPSWEGTYIGVNAGAVWQRGTWSADPGGSDYAVSGSTSATGFIGGGQIGHNWLSGQFLYGLEADISGLTGTGTDSININNTKGTATVSQRIKWLSTVRGRLGVVMSQSWMAYATGGFAFGGVENSFNAGCPGCVPNIKSESKTRTGWTAGGGIEHMLDAHWIVGLEGLWVDLGSSTATAPTTGRAKTSSFSNKAFIARAKLDYKF